MSKKLQSEVEKAMKEIRLNIELYDEKWEELLHFNQNRILEKDRFLDESRKEMMRGKKHAVRTASLELMDYKHVNDAKAKIENDLESILRKLHRLKQQLVEWNSNFSDKDLRNKEELVDYRKLIELRYKRGKIFYKQGSSSENYSNSQGKLQLNVQRWMNEFIHKLNQQSDSWRNEIEKLTGARKKSLDIQDKILQLSAMVDLHQMNIKKLEGLLKALLSETLKVENPNLDRLKRELEPYIYNNQDMVIVVTEDVYTELGFTIDNSEESILSPQDSFDNDTYPPIDYQLFQSSENLTNSINFSTSTSSESSTTITPNPNLSLNNTELPNGIKINNLKDDHLRLEESSFSQNLNSYYNPQESHLSHLEASNKNIEPNFPITNDRETDNNLNFKTNTSTPLQPSNHSTISTSISDDLQPCNKLNTPKQSNIIISNTSTPNGTPTSALWRRPLNDSPSPNDTPSALSSSSCQKTTIENNFSELSSPSSHSIRSLSYLNILSSESSNSGLANPSQLYEEPAVQDTTKPINSNKIDNVLISSYINHNQLENNQSSDSSSPNHNSLPSPDLRSSDAGLIIIDEATQHWNANDKNQLSVVAGQKLFIHTRHSSGWTYGYTKLDSGKISFGWFPNNICRSVKNLQKRVAKADSFAPPPSLQIEIPKEPHENVQNLDNFHSTHLGLKRTNEPIQTNSSSSTSIIINNDFHDGTISHHYSDLKIPASSPSVVSTQSRDKNLLNLDTEIELNSVQTSSTYPSFQFVLDSQTQSLKHNLPITGSNNITFSSSTLRKISIVEIVPDQLEVKEVKWNWNGELTDGSGTLLLKFRQGERIEILAHHKTGWVFGRIHDQPDRLGWFPDYMLREPSELIPHLFSPSSVKDRQFFIPN